ncbi:energy transducer TonB [Calditrichota bacterium LG25]
MDIPLNFKAIKQDREKQVIILAFILSLLFHFFLFWLLNQEGLFQSAPLVQEKTPPQDVVITFPENKPKSKEWKIVENTNEDDQKPQETDLLSDRNSRARNPERTNRTGSLPRSAGNVKIPDYSAAPTFKNFQAFQTKTFNKRALIGEGATQEALDEESTKPEAPARQSRFQPGHNQILDQKDFSVEELGAISLSTYKWEWAPYVNAFKNKLYQVWFAPAAYYQLGLIHGYTVIRFTIDRDGQLIDFAVLKQVGHKSLEVASSEAIKAVFPFIPLPEDFPEEKLTITAKLIYPDLRKGR